MLLNRSVPSSTMVPELPYEDVAVASDWLCSVFGFRERVRMGDHRAQPVLGDGAVILTNRKPRQRASMLVRVDDADRHHEQAKKSGGRILEPPTDHPHGERQCGAEDLDGHVWTFSQSIADVDPVSWGGTLR